MADKQMDPAREVLRAAIVARDAIIDRVEGSKAAISRIEDQIFAANRRLREARTQASEEEAARIEQIVAGGSATLLERNSRAFEGDIEAEITSLRVARDLCRNSMNESDRDLVFVEHRVTSAIGAVMASAAGKLIAEAEAQRAAFFGSVSVLRFLRSSLSDIQRQRVDQVSAYPTDFYIGEHPARAVWRSAAESLSCDAGAPLPE